MVHALPGGRQLALNHGRIVATASGQKASVALLSLHQAERLSYLHTINGGFTE